MSSKKSEEINVYWSPAAFCSEEMQWNLLYSEPKLVYNNLISDSEGKSLSIQCPATQSVMKNLYSLHSTVTDDFSFSRSELQEIEKDKSENVYKLNTDAKCALVRQRPSSHPGYVNVAYNLSWLMFADQPLIARLSAPYYPASSPVEGAMLGIGEFDIGKWFRPLVLDYQIPVNATRFSVKEGQPLAFVEFFSKTKINIHRFRMTKVIEEISNENEQSPGRYGRRKTLEKKYEMFRRSGMKEVLMSEIKKNLVQ